MEPNKMHAIASSVGDDHEHWSLLTEDPLPADIMTLLAQNVSEVAAGWFVTHDSATAESLEIVARRYPALASRAGGHPNSSVELMEKSYLGDHSDHSAHQFLLIKGATPAQYDDFMGKFHRAQGRDFSSVTGRAWRKTVEEVREPTD